MRCNGPLANDGPDVLHIQLTSPMDLHLLILDVSTAAWGTTSTSAMLDLFTPCTQRYKRRTSYLGWIQVIRDG